MKGWSSSSLGTTQHDTGTQGNDVRSVAQHNSTTAKSSSKRHVGRALNTSRLGDSSRYLLPYSCGHKPSEGCKTSQYPLCRLVKVQPHRTFQSERKAVAEHTEKEEKRHVSLTLIGGKGQGGRKREKHFWKESISHLKQTASITNKTHTHLLKGVINNVNLSHLFH